MRRPARASAAATKHPSASDARKLTLVISILVAGCAYLVYRGMMPRTRDYRWADCGESLLNKTWYIRCKSAAKFPDCSPKRCFRSVIDNFASAHESQLLRQMADFGISLTGGASGGPSILDLTSGAVSKGEVFVDAFALLKQQEIFFASEQLQTYNDIKRRVRLEVQRISQATRLFATKPSFFARIDGSKPAHTLHDEYWHPHVDALQYGNFSYTGLLYLNDYRKNFTGGEFAFMDEHRNATVLPETGRLLIFTSGRENVHQVRKVTTGVRYVLTVAFTCDENAAVNEELVRR